PTSHPSSLVRDLDPALERVILRCLEPDPAGRPASAVQVVASLPGGDPLAAAIAAGETPSPELVAAAGEEGVLEPLPALALLAGTVALLVALAFVSQKRLSLARMEIAPEVLRTRAADALR